MSLETIETRICNMCNRFQSGNPESFKDWISYRKRNYQDSTEYRTYHLCPICQALIKQCKQS